MRVLCNAGVDMSEGCSLEVLSHTSDSPLPSDEILDLQVDEASDEEKLVIETPKKITRKRKVIDISDIDKQLLEDIEEEFENALDEKAAKNNLKNVQVKNIIRQVITNEQVIAFVKHAENPTEEFTMQYEPKITRAKARELSVETPFWPRDNDEEPSETHVLINEELPEEDSSEDEYVPVEEVPTEDSEDEHNLSFTSESTQPSTPIHSADCSTQTNWTEDGAFKIPLDKNDAHAKEIEEANIARRTRSKLCLSNTPLEDIESTFIPPDITTDMYEMDYECDEDWKNFLKGFTRPLAEVSATMQEDEDHDPEYNVLADEEVIDVEELRTDRAVNITRKELNDLIGELMDYADNFNNYFPEQDEQPEEPEKSDNTTVEYSYPQLNTTLSNVVIIGYSMFIMNEDQKALFEQQLRQHIQLLTQGFMMTFQHPELDLISNKFETCLDDLQESASGQTFYDCSNISEALAVVNDWKAKFSCDTTVIREYKQQLAKTISEAKQAKAAGLFYVPKFPKLLMETISKSNLFVYPSLLPRIQYVEANPKIIGFTSSENELIALGLDQFTPYLKQDEYHLKKNGEVKLHDVCHCIRKFMMPSKDTDRLFKHVCAFRFSKDQNPIKLYFEKNIVWPTTHFVVPAKEYLNIPPCKRNPNELPYLWRDYIHPVSATVPVTNSQPITKVTKPPVYNKKFARRRPTQITSKVQKSPRPKLQEVSVQPKNNTPYEFFVGDELYASTPKCKKSLFKLATPGVKKVINIPEAVLKIKFNSSIFNKKSKSTMSSMPSLDVTTAASSTSNLSESECSPNTLDNDEEENNLNNLNEDLIEVSSSTSNEEGIMVDSTVSETTLCDNISMAEEKDNLDDINALVVASSTIKSVVKRRPTGLEKKRAKLKRDFEDNLRLLTDEDGDVIKEKRDRFIQAFYDKVQDTLSMEDFHKFMAALNDFDEHQTSPKVLYNQVSEIMGNKHPDIMDEFLLFFDSLQAKTLGKLVPFLIMSNMSLFLRKLELFFQDQPSQVRKIYRAITDLSTRNDVTMAQVKSSVLPLLKGNGLLTDWFLQIFPMEKPPARLINGAWETICLSKDTDDTFEHLVLPEVDDPYGGPNCICNCHSVEDDRFKARSQHCTPCGTKFMQGRVFLQTGKGLRPAKITFEDTSVDHRARLSGSLKKRSDTSPVKLISPGKDSQDETRQSSDEEPPEKKQQRLVKTIKKRKPRKKVNVDSKDVEKESLVTETKMIIEDSPKETTDRDEEEIVCRPRTTSVDVVDVTPMLLADEPQEWDCNTSMDSLEIRLSPEPCQESAESESECCEEFETSQDNNSDSDVSVSGNDGEPINTTTASSLEPTIQPWTREEDKVILETFQKEEVIDIAFKRILVQLKNRTLDQVKERFDVLINFLKKMRDSR